MILLSYTDICNDELIKEQLYIIDSKNKSYMNHGFQHANNVVLNIEKIANTLMVDNETISYLKIAGYLHDIGQVEGDINHTRRGVTFAKNYLEDKCDIRWLDKILSAIENHHEKTDVFKLPLFDHIVLFADKMDFSHMRLDKNYIRTHKNESSYFESNILNINFDISNKTFIVIIKFNNDEASTKFKEWDMYDLIIKRIEEFATKLEMSYELKLL